MFLNFIIACIYNTSLNIRYVLIIKALSLFLKIQQLCEYQSYMFLCFLWGLLKTMSSRLFEILKPEFTVVNEDFIISK